MRRPIISVSEIAQEIERYLADEREDDGEYMSPAIELDVDDLECWRDSIRSAQGLKPLNAL